ncbi:MAG TPA: alpha/beta fold hydrolase [Mycobacteriales bacterium]|nr:alpha/beta fold hydrolase [Mycobacteriales bacterium]
MRARDPDRSGTIVRNGVRIAYDVYGDDLTPTVVLCPTWAIADSRHWKAQIPVLARRYRVLVVDGPGNGRSDRPADPAAYLFAEQADDVLAVMDETGTEQAVVAGLSCGGIIALLLGAKVPERVLGIFTIAPAPWALGGSHPERDYWSFTDELPTDEGWAIYNQHAWRRDLRKFAEYFWSHIFTEPHSSKQIEDGVGWTMQTDAETLIATQSACETTLADKDETLELLHKIRCPILILHGSDDAIMPPLRSELIAAATGADLVILEGSGHCPQARDPIVVNRLFVEFVDRVTPHAARPARRSTWTRALRRPRRVLYLSSPIGLGHARRDLAIARALREERGDVRVEWLAQHPVTTFLEWAGEEVHPASSWLVSESAHVESEAHEHDLHAFEAIRRMDEILVANFSVVQDLVEDGDYDLVVGDEAWDIDHFWHENPELKRCAYAWMTDFVGWLPMPDGGEREAALTADYNAEMLEHVERFRRVRDAALFVGDPDDIVPDAFGPGLPAIRDWTVAHYEFTGYVSGLDAAALGDRPALRRRLGMTTDAPLVVVTVGGSGVGTALLRKVIDAYPRLRKEVDGLRMLVVAGPRVDIGTLPSYDGVEVRGYVPDLPSWLAACDAAIVQGGLTTTMELVATGRPFVYFPLGHHFEQQRHVRHRLTRHRAGRCLDYADTDADDIAAALVDAMGSTPDYLPVPADGAARAAKLLSALL